MLLLGVAACVGARTRAAGQAAPAPVAIPGITINTAGLGTWTASGAASWAGMTSAAPVAGRDTGLTNGWFQLQKTSGKWRFLAQAGVYGFPVVGAPWRGALADTAVFGAAPQAYGEWDPNGHWSLRAGILPTMLGPENTFSAQNFNIERGLIWSDLENTASRAAQVNYAAGRWTASLQFGDGFFSRNFGAVSGQIVYAPSAADSLTAVLLVPNAATPPNATFHDANARVGEIGWTHARGRWTWEPYLVVWDSPAAAAYDDGRAARAWGADLTVAYGWSPHWITSARGEYAAGGAAGDGAEHQNVLGFGSGASAVTLTLTGGWQNGPVFARLEWAAVGLSGFTPGDGFGSEGGSRFSGRAALEMGVVF